MLGLIVLALRRGGLHPRRRRACASRSSRSRPSTSRSSCRTPRRSSRARGRPCGWPASRSGASPASRSSSGIAVVDVELEPEYDEPDPRGRHRAAAAEDGRSRTCSSRCHPGTGQACSTTAGASRSPTRCRTSTPTRSTRRSTRDTRPYLKLLVSGAGKGLRGRGTDLREVFRRFEPVHRDLARVDARDGSPARGAQATDPPLRRAACEELGRRPGELRRLVSASSAVFDTLASEDRNISTSVARLPGSLRATERALAEVRSFAPAAAHDARVAARADPRAARHQRGAHAVLRGRRRRSCATRSARSCAPRGPFTDDLRLAATRPRQGDARPRPRRSRRPTASSTWAPTTRAAPRAWPGCRCAQQRARNEGFLYWLAWTAQNGVSLLNTADAPGTVAAGDDLRRPGADPAAAASAGVLADRRRDQPRPRPSS